ncbi:MAG: DNA-binding response regulator [Roseateles depolymerans]|uniref:DNA-binding response regulator n=1 Tax=Roseateles depolymerans TaxID=76731 RepID=A0A2W5E104_9BURK|nr:MAG: DNA-binding response regulator [Roseateles depolymerans]
MKILLVDEFPMVRAALTGLVLQLFPEADVQGVADAPEALVQLQATEFRLVMLDLKASGGLALLRHLHEERRMLPVVVICGSGAADDALRAFSAGAVGYVPDRCDLATLSEALHLVLAGGTYMPIFRAGDVVSLAPPAAAPADAAAPDGDDWETLPLTPRQKVVLQLLARGLSNKLIARELGVSVETVKDHVAAVLKALGVGSRTQAALRVTRRPPA